MNAPARAIVAVCSDCGREGMAGSRGVCSRDWNRRKRAGTLSHLPRAFRRPAETLEEATFLFVHATTDLDTIAGKLGIEPGSLVRNLERHRSALIAGGAPGITETVAEVDRVLVPLRAQHWSARYVPVGAS